MKKLLKTITLMFCAIGAFNLLSCKIVRSFPNHEITVICPWAEGGESDALLRTLSVSAEKYLGQKIIVENRTGGSGAVGFSVLKEAPADGYTVGLLTSEVNQIPLSRQVNFSYEDYEPLIRLTSDPALLIADSAAPYDTAAEFIGYCKNHPDQVKIGNSAEGSFSHMAAGLLVEKTGVNVRHVSFDGVFSSVSALESGAAQVAVVFLSDFKKKNDFKNIKVLGVMDSERHASCQNVKTFKEQGIEIEFSIWRGLALPKNTEQAAKDKLVDAFTKAVNDSDFINKTKELNMTVACQNPAEFESFLKNNFENVSLALNALTKKRSHF